MVDGMVQNEQLDLNANTSPASGLSAAAPLEGHETFLCPHLFCKTGEDCSYTSCSFCAH